MRARPGCLAWLVLCFTCSFAHCQAKAEEPPAAAALWEKGQAAMSRGHPEQAVEWYLQSLGIDPALTRNHLSLAAAYLELGKWDQAGFHLGKYVAAHPEETDIRSQYAEVLQRLRREKEARAELESCVADTQEQTGSAAVAHLIHCHSRLMELAAARQDAYEEHLNRGIGLYLLARQTAGVPEAEMPSEGLYCKAAGELTLAREERPSEARPIWYLYAVWSRLAQPIPAGRCLRDAAEAAPFSYLTPGEQRALHLASEQLGCSNLSR